MCTAATSRSSGCAWCAVGLGISIELLTQTASQAMGTYWYRCYQRNTPVSAQQQKLAGVQRHNDMLVLGWVDQATT